MSGRIQALESGIKKISRLLNNISAVILSVLFLLGAADVIGRYLFNKPITGTAELGKLLLALMVLFSWGHTQILKGHVNIDMFISRFPTRPRAITNFITTLIALIFSACFRGNRL